MLAKVVLGSPLGAGRVGGGGRGGRRQSGCRESVRTRAGPVSEFWILDCGFWMGRAPAGGDGFRAPPLRSGFTAGVVRTMVLRRRVVAARRRLVGLSAV